MGPTLLECFLIAGSNFSGGQGTVVELLFLQLSKESYESVDTNKMCILPSGWFLRFRCWFDTIFHA